MRRPDLQIPETVFDAEDPESGDPSGAGAWFERGKLYVGATAAELEVIGEKIEELQRRLREGELETFEAWPGG